MGDFFRNEYCSPFFTDSMSRSNSEKVLKKISKDEIDLDQSLPLTKRQKCGQVLNKQSVVTEGKVLNLPEKCSTRQVPWRKPGSKKNERMRGAVWVYRFAPMVPCYEIKKAFEISGKTLMRYVKDSCLPTFAKYQLYFGEA